MKKCSKGMIVRNGYTRKIKNKIIKVKPGCIVTQSASGLKRSELNSEILKKRKQLCLTQNRKYKTNHKCNVLFQLEKGTLSKFGYSMKNTQESRHKSLKKAIKHIKRISIYRRLIALYVLNKNKYPANAKIFRNDAEWIKIN